MVTKITRWKTDDGMTFNTELEAYKHENAKLVNEINNLRFVIKQSQIPAQNNLTEIKSLVPDFNGQQVNDLGGTSTWSGCFTNHERTFFTSPTISNFGGYCVTGILPPRPCISG